MTIDPNGTLRAIDRLPEPERRAFRKREKRLRETGAWGAWEHIRLNGVPGGDGWNLGVHTVHRNAVFCVLERAAPGATHLAVASLSGVRPTWREMQRIKNEIAGEDATGVEVYPPQGEVVDAAPMYHLWIVPKLPFTLYEKV